MAKTGRGKKQRNTKRLNAPSLREMEAAEMRPVLEKRCRLMGWRPTEENLRRVRAPQYACTAGRAIEAAKLDPRDAADLWGAVEHMRRVRARARRALDAPSPDPRNATIQMMPTRLATGAEHLTGPVSLPLSEEEEARRALAAARNLDAWVKELSREVQAETLAVVHRQEPCRDWTRLHAGLSHIAAALNGRPRA